MRRVLLQLGSLVVGADVLHGQGVETELVLQAREVVIRRLMDIDPEQVGIVDQLGDGVGLDFAGLPVLVGADGDHT